jgi:hypothetical protein
MAFTSLVSGSCSCSAWKAPKTTARALCHTVETRAFLFAARWVGGSFLANQESCTEKIRHRNT